MKQGLEIGSKPKECQDVPEGSWGLGGNREGKGLVQDWTLSICGHQQSWLAEVDVEARPELSK